jgi:nucleotide-binding universal stress UspA family protein
MMTPKRILLPLGGREAGEAVMPVVGAVARGAGAVVRLLRVFPVPENVVGTHGRVVAYADQEMERLTAEGLEGLEVAEAELDGIPVERAVRFGEPTEEILLEADAFGADLIAVSDRGHWLRRALVPGVAEQVSRKAEVPVLTLRG